MTTEPMPPRLAELLLRASLPRAEQGAVLGDVQEEFGSIAGASGARAATKWYWRQTATSVGPNLARAFRQQVFRISHVVDDADRRSRRWRLGTGAAMIVGGLLLGLSLAQRRHGLADAYDVWPFMAGGVLVALTGSYRAMQFRGRSRRGRILMAGFWVTMPFPFLEMAGLRGLAHSLEPLRWSAWGIQAVVWLWPNGTWPFHRPRTDEISLRVPILQPWTSDKYQTVTIPPLPASMSVPIVGFVKDSSGDATNGGVTPIAPTQDYVFRAGTTIRLFAVVNSPPDAVQASLEIRRASTGRLLGTVPAAVRLATPMLTRRQQFQFDPDDDPLTPVRIDASEVDVAVRLAGLAPGPYTLRLIATTAQGASQERLHIEVCDEQC